MVKIEVQHREQYEARMNCVSVCQPRKLSGRAAVCTKIAIISVNYD